MNFSMVLKKRWWFLLVLIYAIVILIRVSINGASELVSIDAVGFYIAIVSIAYSNADSFKKFVHAWWYWLIKMQFEWEFIANFKIKKESISVVNERNVLGWIAVILETSNLKDRAKDIHISHISNGFVAYIPPFGINLKIENYIDEDPWSDEEYSRIKITGHTLINYRMTRRMLKLFIKMFFTKVESELTGIEEKLYTLRVASGEMDPNFYKDQFIKGFDNVDHFIIREQTETYTVEVNKKFIEIISKYKEDIVDKASNYLLLVK